MPTNYRNEQSNERFAKACASVSKISHKIRASGKAILLCGDFNTDLTIPSLPWSQILLSSLPKDLTVATNSRNYTYVHNSGCVANSGFIIPDLESLKKSLVKVSDEILTSDHSHLEVSVISKFFCDMRFSLK